MLAIVREAIEEHLQLHDFIESHKQTIYEKLEQREGHVAEVQGADDDGGLSCASNACFLAESLALMSGVVSVGTNKENFQAAKIWIKEKFPKVEDVTPVFLALTLIYVVEKGWEDAQKNKDGKKFYIWKNIHDRMNIPSATNEEIFT